MIESAAADSPRTASAHTTAARGPVSVFGRMPSSTGLAESAAGEPMAASARAAAVRTAGTSDRTASVICRDRVGVAVLGHLLEDADLDVLVARLGQELPDAPQEVLLVLRSLLRRVVRVPAGRFFLALLEPDDAYAADPEHHHGEGHPRQDRRAFAHLLQGLVVAQGRAEVVGERRVGEIRDFGELVVAVHRVRFHQRPPRRAAANAGWPQGANPAAPPRIGPAR